jgi:multidrug efflux pump subunit AcrB
MTGFAIRNDRVTFVALAVVLAAGIATYGSMSRSEDPGFLIRTAVVNTVFPGASPERVEMLVTDKLEKAIQEIPQIDYLASKSKTSLSTIYVNIKEPRRSRPPPPTPLRG